MKLFESVLILVTSALGLMAAEMNLPPVHATRLPNGLTADIVPQNTLPLVEIFVAVRGGNESASSNQAGLPLAVADLLRRGTSTYSAQQFSEALDQLGGEFQARTSAQATVLRGEFLSKDFEAGLHLMTDAVLHPTFPQDEVAKYLAQQVDAIKQTKDNPDRAIQSYSHAFFYGNTHPYGQVPDEKSLHNITRELLVEYHRRQYTAANLMIVVVGKIAEAQASESIAAAFGSLPKAEPYVWHPALTLTAPSAPRLLLIDKPGATQTYFTIAQPGIDAHASDRVAMQLVNTLFGGRFTSLLNEELRVKSGLSYGAYNMINDDRLQGANAIETYTKTQSTTEAIDLALKTLADFREHGVTAEQLASAKAYVKGDLPRRKLDSLDQLGSELIRLTMLGFGTHEVTTLFSRIDHVTLDEANAAIQKHFKTEGLTFVVLGDASKIRTQLTKYSAQPKVISVSDPGFGE